MKVKNIGGYKSIGDYVGNKLKAFSASPHTLETLFGFMFSERENVMYESRNEYGIKKTTYGESYKAILRLSRKLDGIFKDLDEGDVIGIYLDNSEKFIEILWAVLKSGFRPLLMNKRLSADILNGALGTLNAKAVISDGDEFAVKTVFLKNVYADLPAETQSESGKKFGEELFVMTSGTSLNVKLCAYSGEEFYHQISDSFDIIRRCKLTKRHYKGELKLLAFLPFYHIFGLVAVYIWFAFFSRTFVSLGDLSPETLLTTIKRHGVTHVFAVPLFWEKIYKEAVKKIKLRGEKTYKKFEKGLKIANNSARFCLFNKLFTRVAFSEVRENLFGNSISFMITGGGKIDENAMAFFNGIGYRLANGYGMSETGITSVELSGNRKLLTKCSIGKPFSSLEYKINENGELLVKGKAVAKYVIQDGKKSVLKNEWFNTHDLAREENGNYYVDGRKDDLIVSKSGENLNPYVIEKQLASCGIEEVCLIPSEDGELPVIIANTSVDDGEATAILKEKIHSAGFGGEIGKIVITKADLIEDGDFKINRRKLRSRYLSGEFTKKPDSGNESKNDDELYSEIRAVFASAAGKSEAETGDDSDFFLDLGGTSLDYFSMLAELREKYGVSTEECSNFKTVKEFADYIKKKGR